SASVLLNDIRRIGQVSWGTAARSSVLEHFREIGRQEIGKRTSVLLQLRDLEQVAVRCRLLLIASGWAQHGMHLELEILRYARPHRAHQHRTDVIVVGWQAVAY